MLVDKLSHQSIGLATSGTRPRILGWKWIKDTAAADCAEVNTPVTRVSPYCVRYGHPVTYGSYVVRISLVVRKDDT